MKHDISERYPDWKNLRDAADVEGVKLTDQRSWLRYVVQLYERGVLSVVEFVEAGITTGTKFEFRFSMLKPPKGSH